MKTILLFLGIVACYAILTLAASPLDASLSSSGDMPLPGASGRPVVVEATTTPPVPIEQPRPIGSSSHRPASVVVPPNPAVIAPESSQGVAPSTEASRAHAGEQEVEPSLSNFEQFAPYIRKPEPQGASASSREYLRDPWVIEDLVLL
jgi:hypothetical protein